MWSKVAAPSAVNIEDEFESIGGASLHPLVLPDGARGGVPAHTHVVLALSNLLSPVRVKPGHVGDVPGVNHRHDPVLDAQLTNEEEDSEMRIRHYHRITEEWDEWEEWDTFHLKRDSLSNTVCANMLTGMSRSGCESKWTILTSFMGRCREPMAR